MVGSTVVQVLRAAGYEVAGTSRSGAEAAVESGVHFRWNVAGSEPPSALTGWKADYLIHAAALTDLDRCESYPDEARRVNIQGTAQVAALANRWGARLIYLSTDSVFDGQRGGYTDDEAPNPVNVYAATKAAGEIEALRAPKALVVRFNVIGPGRLTGWILNSVVSEAPIKVFVDVRFNPVETRDLAQVLKALAESSLTGICHVGSDEVVSKAEYAIRLLRYAGLSGRGKVTTVRLADRPMRTPRPLDTSLRVSAGVAALCRVPSLDAAIRRLAAEFIGGPTEAGGLPAVN